MVVGTRTEAAKMTGSTYVDELAAGHALLTADTYNYDLTILRSSTRSAVESRLKNENSMFASTTNFIQSHPRLRHSATTSSFTCSVNRAHPYGATGYSSNGRSFKSPVAGSTSNPKDSRTTTPRSTLSITPEIQTGKASSLPFTLSHALPRFIFTSPAPVETRSSPITAIPRSSASCSGRTVRLAPVSTSALTLRDRVFSMFAISISTHAWPIYTTYTHRVTALHKLSACELTSLSRAPYVGSDQPSGSQEAVTKGRQGAKGSELKNRSFFTEIQSSTHSTALAG